MVTSRAVSRLRSQAQRSLPRPCRRLKAVPRDDGVNTALSPAVTVTPRLNPRSLVAICPWSCRDASRQPQQERIARARAACGASDGTDGASRSHGNLPFGLLLDGDGHLNSFLCVLALKRDLHWISSTSRANAVLASFENKTLSWPRFGGRISPQLPKKAGSRVRPNAAIRCASRSVGQGAGVHRTQGGSDAICRRAQTARSPQANP
jgi:hypothetical protein